MMIPVEERAYWLLHEGVIELSAVENVGMRIDVGKLRENVKEVKRKIVELEDELYRDETWKVWKNLFGEKANLGSRYQLGRVIFGEMKCPTFGRTATGRPRTDEEALTRLNLPFVDKYLEVEKWKKVLNTYLKGIEREVVDGYLHPSFNLHLVKTYRSSCEMPNFQNIPVRDEEVSRLVRGCFIPRPGHVLVEVDYKALEFRVAACFWRDRRMVEYASDPKKDIHRDMAERCFLLRGDQVTKRARFCAKNLFVFPILYGSYYLNCARNLWEEVPSLETADGKPMADHLRRKGVRSLAQYEEEIKEVEDYLGDLFYEWKDRRELWWERYQRRGWFRMMTGFVCQGVMSRNELFNWPIQGPAFHCLLWSLIKLNKWLREMGMRSLIVGQIHDSIIADVHRSELDDYLNKAREVMTGELRKEWDWVIVPMEVEMEMAEENWFDKKAL